MWTLSVGFNSNSMITRILLMGLWSKDMSSLTWCIVICKSDFQKRSKFVKASNVPVKKHTKLTAIVASAWRQTPPSPNPFVALLPPHRSVPKSAPLAKSTFKQWPLENCCRVHVSVARPTNTRCVRFSLYRAHCGLSQPALSEHRLVACACGCNQFSLCAMPLP